jgi:glycosyltransferase involved in cell wall biosynthesis
MVIYYLANARLPTEKAHGLQIVENCEALAAAGATVTLVAPRRLDAPAAGGSADLWSHYGVAKKFGFRRLPSLDLFPLGRRVERVAFPVQTLTFALSLALAARRRAADVYYSRDPYLLLAMSAVAPRRTLAYEAHVLSRSGLGARLQSLCLRRAGTVIAVSEGLAADLRARGASRVAVERDGFSEGRFSAMPQRRDARGALGLPSDAFIVGYCGRLETMAMSKGVEDVVDAAGLVPGTPLHFCVAGGPAAMVEALGRRWTLRGLPASRFHALGEVRPARVPALLAAFDVGVLTMPPGEHFARHASPLKLFEYMAAGLAIVATSLPSVEEVLRDGENGLLVAPGDAAGLADALLRLIGDPALRDRLGAAARSAAAQYSWRARAARILDLLAASA